MKEKIVRLKPIIENKSYWDAIEKEILKVFKIYFYYPLFDVFLPKDIIINSNDILEAAIKSGKIYYSKGAFHGNFNSKISKELISLGAKFNKKDESYKIDIYDLPLQVRSNISIAKAMFDHKIESIETRLVSFDSEAFSKKVKTSAFFDKALWDVEKQFEDSIKKITLTPQLSPTQTQKISEEWQNNLQLYIQDFTNEQILDLRQKVSENVYAGNRRENLIQTFIDNYNVTHNKAKFLARQETNLLMAKYKETRYVSAGVKEYEWRCVHMPHQSSANSIYKAGEVRYSHGILEGQIFSWSDPPVTTPPGQTQRRNNPGQDYNCRCFALPVVRFKENVK